PHSSAGEADQAVDWAALRLFGVGGTALHYEGIMARPTAEDFQVNTLYGLGRDWPISYAELEPWLLRAEQEIGVSGDTDNPYAADRSGPFPMPAHPFSYFDREMFGPALDRLGITGHSCPRAVNSVPYRGRSACQACRACKFCPTGARYSPDRVHIPMLDAQPNVTVMDKVSLRRLETGPAGDRIAGAHAVQVEEGTELVVRAEHYILALGGVETPRMLLISADGNTHAAGLGNMGGQLGRGFSDHLSPYVTYDLGRPVGSRLGFETMACDHFRVQKDRREQPTFMTFASPVMDWLTAGNEAATWATENGVLSLEKIRASVPRMAVIMTMPEMEGTGTLELDDSQLDAFGSPVAKVTLRLTEWDRQGPAKLAMLAPEFAEAIGASSFSGISAPEFGLGYHPSGATAMANNPDEGVCDPNLKVFGLKNLHLVSNSVFPHMGGYPPTLTIVALALRLAAHLGR
ncbi:MAG: GMC family oxidoreductase, partial [Gammaproteobacteria bacterium]